MRITSKGQVTIPKHVRDKAGLMPGTDVDFVLEGRNVRLVKNTGKKKKKTRGQLLVERLEGTANTGMTTDEILALMRGPEE